MPTLARREEMTRIREIVAIALVLTACSGPPAQGQTSPPGDGSLERIHIYEVAPEQISQASETGFIEVSGTATVEVPVDRAHVSFAVETRAETAAEAAGANADAMDVTLRALRGGGFEDLTVETFGYTLRPEYTTNQQRARVIDGYAALNNVRATTTDVDAVGGVIDVAVAAGANRITSIAFDATDTRAARSEALTEAVRNARTQASAIAQALGYQLGEPLEIRGGAQRPVPRPVTYELMAARAEMAAPTPIEAGDQTVSASVTIRFALGPELPGH